MATGAFDPFEDAAEQRGVTRGELRARAILAKRGL
jgi:hypothetical protein